MAWTVGGMSSSYVHADNEIDGSHRHACRLPHGLGAFV